MRVNSSIRAGKVTRIVLSTCLMVASCSVSASDQPNVLLVCIDTLRADHLGCYGYDRNPTSPTLDALARESIQFMDASAVAGWTKPSVPSYMTGTYPAQHGVYEGSSKDGEGRISHVLPEDAVTIAEVFSDRGYRTGAFVQNAQLRLGQGIEQGFEDYVDRAGDARQIRWQALDWLDQQPNDRPFFLYLHLLDAHWPYPVPDEFAARFSSPEEIAVYRDGDWKQLRDAINDGDVEFGEKERRSLENLYDGAIRYADHELGLLFDGLRQRRTWKNTVVCVLSDHGEEFGEHGRIGHGHGLWENLLSVPWILRIPGRAPDRIENAVSLIDLLPTLCAASGLTPPGTFAGINRLNQPNIARPIFAEHKAPDRYMQSLRENNQKLVRQLRRASRSDSDRLNIAPGERWEAELERLASGQLHVTQLKLRDEPVGDPAELKGIITELTERYLDIGGIRVVRTPSTEVRMSDETTALSSGVLAKVRINRADEGLIATRIKLYPPTASPAFEIRGAVLKIEGKTTDGWISIAGISAHIDIDTTFKGSSNKAPRVTRSDIRQFLGGTGFPANRVVDEFWHLAPNSETRQVDEDHSELIDHLSSLSKSLAWRAYYTGDDSSTLSEEEIQQLEAIGYVE